MAPSAPTGNGDSSTRSEAHLEQLAFLFQEAPRVSFYQAVLLLEQAFPDAPLLGHDGPALRERIRIRDVPLELPTAVLA